MNHDSNHDRREADVDDVSIIAKVRKLLAKAERTDNPHEADAFSRKAADLIASRRLDPDRLQRDAADTLLVRKMTLGRGPYVRARLSLLQAVARANGCRVIISSGHNGTIANVVGYTSDLETVELLYTSLHAQAATRMAQVRRGHNGATQRVRRSFLFGFADQVGVMLADARATAEASHAVAPVQVAGANDDAVADFIRDQFGRLTRARRPSLSSVDGWQEGRDAASRSDLGRRGMRETPSIDPAA